MNKLMYIGYSGNENFFTCDSFLGTKMEAEQYFSDEPCFKIVSFEELPQSEREIVMNCIPPSQLAKMNLYIGTLEYRKERSKIIEDCM